MAINFDGTGDKVSVASDLGITGTNCLLGGWFKLSAQPATDSGFSLLGQEDAGNKVGFYIIYYDTSGTPSLIFRRGKFGDANQDVSNVQTLTTGTWYHILLAYDSSATGAELEGFLDGVSQGTAVATGNGSAGGTDQFTVGDSTQAGDLNGVVSHIVAYSGEPSQALINRIMLSRPPDNDTNLLVYWPFDESTGSTAKDHAGNDHDGTLTNATYVSDSPPTTYK